MGDKSLRGRGRALLGGVGGAKTPRGLGGLGAAKTPRAAKTPGETNFSDYKNRGGPKTPGKTRIKTYGEEINASPKEAMGVWASGGHEGKPHSTKEGRLAAGHRNLTRFFYGRKKKKPKGTTV